MTHQEKEKTLELAELCMNTFARMEKEASDKEAQQEKIAGYIPEVVDVLLAKGRIDPHEKEAAAEALTDHLQTLELLKLAALHKNTEELTRLGVEVSEKSAEVDNTRNHESEADHQWFVDLGVR